jgi:hypothetical protein
VSICGGPPYVLISPHNSVIGPDTWLTSMSMDRRLLFPLLECCLRTM